MMRGYIQRGDFGMFSNMFAGAFVLCAVLFLLVVALWVFVSYRFACIAEQKGYSKTAYFFVVFFLCIVGCIWVCALKDKVLDNKLDLILAQQNEIKGCNCVEK
jgi:hypothetical protein